MKRGKLRLGLAMLMLLAGTGVAGATCTALGKVARLRAGPGAGGNYVDIQPLASLPPYNSTFEVKNNLYYILLGSSIGGHTVVQVTGDAASCPTSGAFRNGGVVIGVDILPNI
ncbi:MAG TPA: hypothetical protein VFG05_10910 [Methylocella sp.]|nr:hypothetical protein [Methylocella sp.]